MKQLLSGAAQKTAGECSWDKRTLRVKCHILLGNTPGGTGNIAQRHRASADRAPRSVEGRGARVQVSWHSCDTEGSSGSPAVCAGSPESLPDVQTSTPRSGFIKASHRKDGQRLWDAWLLEGTNNAGSHCGLVWSEKRDLTKHPGHLM